jgi:hypothetical protein
LFIVACTAATVRCTMGQDANSSRPPRQQLITLAWREQELGVALQRLSESQRLRIWVDRRVDRSARVNLIADRLSIAEVLESLASQHGAAVAHFRGVTYFGTVQTAVALPQLASRVRAEINALPRSVQTKWLAASEWKCSRLSEPRAFIEQTAASVGAELAGADQIPHDLWPARQLPAMAAVDRLVLLLANFDLTFDVADGGGTIKLEPIDYSKMGALKSPRPFKAPHEQTLQPRRVEDRRFTLRIVNQPAGSVIEQLADRLGFAVIWDASLESPDAPERRTLVSCDVREASLEELLAAILEPAGIQALIQGTELRLKRTGDSD